MKITIEQIEAQIVEEQYHRFPGTTFTVCMLQTKNGYVATGESACADAADFDPVKGKKYAREQAIDKLWNVLGYELRTKLMETKQNGDQCSNL